MEEVLWAQMVKNLMALAHHGEDGPSGDPVASLTKTLWAQLLNPSERRSQGAVFTEGGQEGNTVWGGNQSSSTIDVHS